MAAKKDFSDMPGPRGFPLVGSAVQLATFPEITLMKWAEENYGNVFRYKMFGQDCVLLNGYEAIKEGLIDIGSDMSGRITCPALKALRDSQGLFFIDYGEQWKEMKPFISKAVITLMKELPEKISSAAQKFDCDYLQDAAENETPIELEPLLKRSMAQVVLYAILDKEIPKDEQDEFDQVIQDIYEPVSTVYFSVLLFAQWLSRFPPFSGYITEETKNRKNLVAKFVNWIEQDRNKTVADSPFPSITEQFYAEHPDPTSEQLKSLSLVFIDMVFAGSATTSNQLSWVILYLLKSLGTMERVQLELSEAMKEVKDITELHKMRENVPYTMAVIEETLRLRPIAPNALFHKTTKETHAGGYKIPKGVVINPNLWSVHHDSKLWGPDPEKFRPERHLDESGKFMKSEFVMPFSIGDRRCPGQPIAQADIFVFLTSLLLKYDFSLAEDSEDIDMDGRPGAILRPEEFKVLVKQRK